MDLAPKSRWSLESNRLGLNRHHLPTIPGRSKTPRERTPSSLQELDISLGTMDLCYSEYLHYLGSRMELVQSEIRGGGFCELLFGTGGYVCDVCWVEGV